MLSDKPQGVHAPLLDLKIQFAPLREKILRAITRVCDSQRFVLGQEGEGLERELTALIGVGHAIGVSSGTDALALPLTAPGIVPGGDEATNTQTPFSDRQVRERPARVLPDKTIFPGAVQSARARGTTLLKRTETLTDLDSHRSEVGC